MDKLKGINKKLNNTGITLVEVLIALSILATVIGVVFSMGMIGLKSFGHGIQQVDIQYEVRRASNAMVDELRNAKNISISPFSGCKVIDKNIYIDNSYTSTMKYSVNLNILTLYVEAVDGDKSFDLTTKVLLNNHTDNISDNSSGYLYYELPEAIDFTATFETLLNNDATLKELVVSEGSLEPSFNGDTYNYNVVLPEGSSGMRTINIAKPSDSNAKIVKTFAADVSGIEEDCTAKVIVTAEDGATIREYKILFSLANSLASDAGLSNVTISDGIWDNIFNTDEFHYIIELPYGSTDIPDITSELNDPNASIEINEADNITGTQIERTTVIIVTAENGIDKKTYNFEFKVASIGTVQVESINIISDKDHVYYGESLDLGVEVLPNDADNKDVVWSVYEGGGIVSVNSEGVVITNTDAEGVVRIKAVASDGSGVGYIYDLNVYKTMIINPTPAGGTWKKNTDLTSIVDVSGGMEPYTYEFFDFSANVDNISWTNNSNVMTLKTPSAAGKVFLFSVRVTDNNGKIGEYNNIEITTSNSW